MTGRMINENSICSSFFYKPKTAKKIFINSEKKKKASSNYRYFLKASYVLESVVHTRDSWLCHCYQVYKI